MNFPTITPREERQPVKLVIPETKQGRARIPAATIVLHGYEATETSNWDGEKSRRVVEHTPTAIIQIPAGSTINGVELQEAWMSCRKVWSWNKDADDPTAVRSRQWRADTSYVRRAGSLGGFGVLPDGVRKTLREWAEAALSRLVTADKQTAAEAWLAWQNARRAEEKAAEHIASARQLLAEAHEHDNARLNLEGAAGVAS